MIKLYNEDCLNCLGKIDDKSINLVLTDLPYTFKNKNRVTANKWDLPIDDTILWQHLERIITDDGAIVMTATNPFASYLVMNHLNLFKYDWVWEKNNGSNFVSVKHQAFRVHEYVLVFGKQGITFNKANKYMKYNPQFTYSTSYNIKRDGNVTNLASFSGRIDTNNEDGHRYPRSVQKFNLERGLHPTQKPVELMEFLVKTYTDENDYVLDCCMGSGTTGVASVKNGRNFIGIELEEEYFNIAKERINNIGDVNN